MYAQFHEDEGAPSPATAHNNDMHEPQVSYASGESRQQQGADESRDDHRAPAAQPPIDKANLISALRLYVAQNAMAPPHIWRRYRHLLPTSVADLKLIPAALEPLQGVPSHTFVLQLNTIPENSVYEWCSQLIDYVMIHMKHVGAQAPILMLRFVKIGLEIAQCVVTIGNNNVALARQVAANLTEVGFQVGFAPPKPLQPSATFQLWDVKRMLNDGRGIEAEDIEELLSSEGPGGQPIAGSISVVKGFEEGVWYAASKRPDPVHSWLMNQMSSWLFQRELYEKLGVLLTIANCEHDWAQKRGWGAIQEMSATNSNTASFAQNAAVDRWKDDNDDSASDDDEAEAIDYVQSNIDIFGDNTKKPNAAAASKSTGGGAADGGSMPNAFQVPDYQPIQFPELVQDDDDEEDDFNGGLLGAAPVSAGEGAASRDFNAGVNGGMYFPPSSHFHHHQHQHQHHQHQHFFPPHQHHHHPSFGPLDGSMPTYSSIPQSFHDANTYHSGNVYPEHHHHHHHHGAPFQYNQHQHQYNNNNNAFNDNTNNNYTYTGINQGYHSGGGGSAVVTDNSPVPEIFVPQTAGASRVLQIVDAAEAADPALAAKVFMERDNYVALFDLVSGNIQFDKEEERHTLLLRVVNVLLRHVPSSEVLENPMRFKPPQRVLDAYFFDRQVHNFPMLCRLLRLPEAEELRTATSLRIVAHLDKLPFRTITMSILEADTSVDNPLIRLLAEDPVQWCADAAAVTRKRLFTYPHLMVPYGVNGLRTIFEHSSGVQQDEISASIRLLTREGAHRIVETAELLGRAFLVTAVYCRIIDANWLVDRFNNAPLDNRAVAGLVDFSCVVVYGRGDTLISDAMLQFAGMYCAYLEQSPSQPTAPLKSALNASVATDEQKLDFLHNFVLRRFFAPAQDKYLVFRDAFIAKATALGCYGGLLSTVVSTPTWPRRPAQGLFAAPPPPPPPPAQAKQSAAILSAPVLPVAPPILEGMSSTDPSATAGLIPIPKPIVVSFSWCDDWSDVFSVYPPMGEPFPPMIAPSTVGAAVEDVAEKVEAPQATSPPKYKAGVSKSYGHYYFKSEEKGSKPTYRHPITQKEYMVSPQEFFRLESGGNASDISRETLCERCGSTQEEFEEWFNDQRKRNPKLDVGVMSLFKITYKTQASSGNSGSSSGTAMSAVPTASSTNGLDISEVLKAQRDLERRLRFVAELKYPSRGHPFPPLPKGWTCSLSASNGLYYFRNSNAGKRENETSYEHPITKEEYAPTPQAYAFFQGLKEHALMECLSAAGGGGVSRERISKWLADQTVRDSDIDYFVVEKIGVRYGRAKRGRSRSRSGSRNRREK